MDTQMEEQLYDYINSLQDDMDEIANEEGSCCDGREYVILNNVKSALLYLDTGVTFNEALNIVTQFDDWVDEVDFFDPTQLSGAISTTDCNDLAHHLANSYPTEAAELLDNLLYWRKAGRI